MLVGGLSDLRPRGKGAIDQQRTVIFGEHVVTPNSKADACVTFLIMFSKTSGKDALRKREEQ